MAKVTLLSTREFLEKQIRLIKSDNLSLALAYDEQRIVFWAQSLLPNKRRVFRVKPPSEPDAYIGELYNKVPFHAFLIEVLVYAVWMGESKKAEIAEVLYKYAGPLAEKYGSWEKAYAKTSVGSGTVAENMTEVKEEKKEAEEFKKDMATGAVLAAVAAGAGVLAHGLYRRWFSEEKKNNSVPTLATPRVSGAPLK